MNLLRKNLIECFNDKIPVKTLSEMTDREICKYLGVPIDVKNELLCEIAGR